MATVVRHRVIAAELDEVWARLADFGAISAWAPNVEHSCLLTEQAEGVGAERRIQSDGRTVVETVETWEPHAQLSYRLSGLPPVINRLTNSWTLAREGAATAVTLTTEIDVGPRPPQQGVARLIGRRMAAVSDQMLDGLADNLTRHAEPVRSGGLS